MPVSDYVLKEAAGTALASSADYDSNNHKVEDALLTALGPLVVSGGVVTAGTGLSVNITDIVVIIGVLLSKLAWTLGGLTPSATNEIFAVTDPDDPDGLVAVSTSNGSVPARSAHLATAITSGVGVTSVTTPTDRYQLTSLAKLANMISPNVFKSVQASASGNTNLWTPATGKKFRLQRFMVIVTGDAALAAGADLTIGLQDATTDLELSTDVFVPGTSVTTGADNFCTGWIDLGDGILSAAANNVLHINLSAALTAGKVRVLCCGTEE